LLAEAVRALRQKPPQLLIPIPLHASRYRQRGFNQARELAGHLGPPLLEVLRRRLATRAQVELAADQRRANVSGAFVMRRCGCGALHIRGKTLVLIDDVSTTGATLESCARVLRDAGAAHVYALTAARVVSPSPTANRPPHIG
jgi:ComF family protein